MGQATSAGRGFLYVFPAMRGIQAGREYYVLLCPLKLLPKLFLYDEDELPAELRAQRTLNRARVPEIARYLVDNPRDYALSSITASVDGDVTFDPVGDSGAQYQLGTLSVPMSARFLINDGQHRRAAIATALAQRATLGDETISVVLFLDSGLKRSQQMFADLNKHAVRPSRSLGVLYDHREPLAGLARELAEAVPSFVGMVELEKTSISNRSRKLFTLSALYQATAALLGRKDGAREPIRTDERKLACEFWSAMGGVFPEWVAAARGEARSHELRQNYVHPHAVTLHALGMAGHALVSAHPEDWRQRLDRLRNLDWSRKNAELWEGRTLIGGRVSKAHQSLLLTSALLKRAVGVSPSPEEERLEAGVADGQMAGGRGRP